MLTTLHLYWLAFRSSVRDLFRSARLTTPQGLMFAALTTEQPIKTWKRVQSFQESTMSAGAAEMFRAFKSWIIQNKAELNLQMLVISDLTDDVNDLDGALRVYAIYLKKQATATDAFYKLFDDATNSGTAGDERVTLPVFEASKEVLAFFPDGLPMADGIVQTSHTTSSATSDTTTGDGPNGFLLVGAA